MPSLPDGTPFSISIHSWNKPALSADLGLFQVLDRTDKAAIGIRVTIDGTCVTSSTFAPSASWPQLMKDLSFPAFNKAVLSRRDWNIADDTGRINVLISEGLQTDRSRGVHFQPVRNLACFSFHPAPIRESTHHLPFQCGADRTIEHLEQCNIAWPNVLMYTNPWTPTGQELCGSSMLATTSDSDSGFTSTSNTMPPPPIPDHVSVQHGKQLELRLPSDQLCQIIAALTQSKTAAPETPMRVPRAPTARMLPFPRARLDFTGASGPVATSSEPFPLSESDVTFDS